MNCSYPTYEEWKLTNEDGIVVSPTSMVLILPMRNGNCGRKIFVFGTKSVLILPMRNGNQWNISWL